MSESPKVGSVGPGRGGPNRGGGRKPKPADQRLSRTISVSLNADQAAFVDGLSDDHSLTPSEMVRVLVESARRTDRGAVPPTPELMARRIIEGLRVRTGVQVPVSVVADLAAEAQGPLPRRRRRPGAQ